MSGSLFDQYKAALRRGHLSAVAGDLDAALDAYHAASELVPERALPIASMGTVLHRLDRWSEAAEAFEYALRLAPDDEATLRARAVARAERGLRSGAASDYERLAFVLDVASRSADAADAARRAADLEPTPAREVLADRFAASAARAADVTRVPLGDEQPAVTPFEDDGIGVSALDRDVQSHAVDSTEHVSDDAVDGPDPRLAFLNDVPGAAREQRADRLHGGDDCSLHGGKCFAYG